MSTCSDCNFSAKADDGTRKVSEDWVECRRYPPTIHGRDVPEPVENNRQGLWPFVRPYAWCGEYKSKPRSW